MVTAVSVRGRRTQGARLLARAATKASSADVSSMRRVKWVVRASRVAMLARRSWPRVFWSTEMRVCGDVEESWFE
jgi:hypothetical protein